MFDSAMLLLMIENAEMQVAPDNRHFYTDVLYTDVLYAVGLGLPNWTEFVRAFDNVYGNGSAFHETPEEKILALCFMHAIAEYEENSSEAQR